MKRVVEEVMKPYQKSKQNPILGGETAYQVPHYPPKSMSTAVSLEGINRPNYQRDKMQKRLSINSGKSMAVGNNHSRNLASSTMKVSSVSTSQTFVEGTLAALQTMSL